MSTPASGADASVPVSTLGERGLIERIRRRFPSPPGVLAVGIGDDAAVGLPARGALEVLTTDALVEGVHFDLAFSTFQDVGFKALAVNVSDVAAMGATPRLALLSLILPERMTVQAVDAILDGFAEAAGADKVVLAGGNITRSPGPLIVDVSLIGYVRPRKVLTRSGGRPGDSLYVSGTIGAAAAGLEWLRQQPADRAEPADPELLECVKRHRRPAARTRLGRMAGQSRAATACMDLSDGLADAVRQVAEQSGAGAVIDSAALPIHPGAARWFAANGKDPVRSAVGGGDDYELLLAVPARRRGRLRHVVQHSGVTLARIGELTREREVRISRDGRLEPLPEGFAHF